MITGGGGGSLLPENSGGIRIAFIQVLHIHDGVYLHIRWQIQLVCSSADFPRNAVWTDILGPKLLTSGSSQEQRVYMLGSEKNHVIFGKLVSCTAFVALCSLRHLCFTYAVLSCFEQRVLFLNKLFRSLNFHVC